MIYLDCAATSFLKPSCVAQAVFDAMHTIGSDGRGAHGLALAASRVVWRCREQVAELFGLTDPARVCFTSGSTEALNTAILGLFGPKDHVITTALEHNSVLRPLYHSGAELTVLPADEKGQIDLSGLEAARQRNTRAVVCTHVSNVTGEVVDIGRIGAFCREHGLLFILDASQSAGVFDIDMERDGISVLCFTGHKSLLGPQGTGGLCVAEGVSIRPLVVGGSGVHSFSRTHPGEYPTRLEAGTLNAHGLAGLSAALDWLDAQGLEPLRQREQALARRFYQGVCDAPGVKIYGDWSNPDRAAIVALNLEGEDAGAVSDALYEDFGICTRPGAHCAPLMHRALGTEEQGIVRFSFSHFNTESEVDAAVQAVRSLCGA
ncbi:aminotransferase class V-fold PLP-dependent enzyme [Intestinibacillus sp. Marseille-P6563]|uniref:aminotransferase class V-fold PLP-dependent enzyme n=1 Tax=Intestinibacillus sp. Marseille-P6563 TaxID=2364792 RepID=UPI000F061BF3|nr:aminotransferase class V-fold PLP-dependent enzyme [Intestinibacillus sp. Marseille-P6563]